MECDNEENWKKPSIDLDKMFHIDSDWGKEFDKTLNPNKKPAVQNSSKELDRMFYIDLKLGEKFAEKQKLNR